MASTLPASISRSAACPQSAGECSMSEESIWLLALLFAVVGALYASVGHAGASGYLAVMALFGVSPIEMRPTALAVNVLVASIASWHFWRAGHFSWRLAGPFLVLAPVTAFVGAAVPIDPRLIRIAIGIALFAGALRMALSCVPPRDRAAKPPEIRQPSRATAIGAGAVIGLFSGITGTGGGIFLSPLMILRRWGTPHAVAAISAVFILANSISGLAGVVAGGWRPDSAVAKLAVAGCLGGLVGARLGSRHFSGAWMR